jgi:hypothetical protein
MHGPFQGYSTLNLQGQEPAASVLPNNELHRAGVPGLNQTLILREQ